MAETDNPINYFALTNFRNQRTTFGIKKNDRPKHMYVVGKTGMGKTTLLENMAVQDIRNGEGLGIVDPHGSFAEKMLDYVPKERIKDVIYFNPSDTEHPIAFNIMEDVGAEHRHLVASGLIGVFKKLWPDVWSARMEYILNNTLLALLEYPDSTLLGVNRMLADKEYRKMVVANVTDPVVKAFWEQEFAKYTDRFAAEATPAIQNKVGQFTANPLIRNIIGQPKSGFDFRRAMDEKKIILMNLSKGRIGELNSQIIGAMLITKIYLAAMSRAANPSADWPDFYLYVDEFQNFATESFRDILSEARKYRLALVLAHQYIAQMDETVRDAVFGNVGTHIVFRVGPADAEFLETEFTPEFTTDDIVNLGLASIYLKLSIDGVPSRPFSAATLPPILKQGESYRNEIIEYSRKNYCGIQQEVEKAIALWHVPIPKEERPAFKPGDFSPSAGMPATAPASPNRGEPSEPRPAPRMFDATCSVCEEKTLVPFEPDGKRPIFCQKHRSFIGKSPSASPSASDRPSRDGNRGEQAVPKPQTIQTQSEGFVSFSQLGEKTHEFRREPVKRKEKPSPDLKALRDLLAQAKSEEEKPDNGNNTNNKSGTLKPGESIKF